MEIKQILPGLYYIENLYFNEYEIIKELDKQTWTPLTSNKNSRVVQHYGYKYNYKTYNIKEKTTDIPEFINPYVNILELICKQLKLTNETYKFNQCIINNYNKGQSISAHTDVKAYGPVIGCFTLGSEGTMVFKKDGEKIELVVKPNSLYIMSEDVRYNWTHEMVSNSNNRRISITLRNVQ